ncbi:MAG: thiamine-phosphate pyrophosphorylase, partial [Myxococcales bacterium]|nr:thiamine-phosphate pyrophosphorylase [Myxococcales bacterium]
ARIAAILGAVPRGSVLVQVREKDLDGAPLLSLVEQVIAVARPEGAPVFVNDRVDVALAAGADGVHLPESGLAIADARALIDAQSAKLAIGCSRHATEAVRPAFREGADLVQLGPIWETPGKSTPLGVKALAIEVPVDMRLVAVGGIQTVERARQAAAAGADAVAVIRAAWTSDDPAKLIASLVAAVGAGHLA